MTPDSRLTAAIRDLLGSAARGLNTAIDQLGWAEDGITLAQRRHRSQSDLMYHSFSLLTFTHDLMATELVYRAHRAELLGRVAAGADTRPGTAAEVCAACHDASMIAPLSTAAFGPYMRMWQAAFPAHPLFTGSASITRPCTAPRSPTSKPRPAASSPRLGTIDCPGRHHGQPVTCTAAPWQRARAA